MAGKRLTRATYGIPRGVTVKEFFANPANRTAIKAIQRERRNTQKRERRAAKKAEHAAEAEIKAVLANFTEPWSAERFKKVEAADLYDTRPVPVRSPYAILSQEPPWPETAAKPEPRRRRRLSDLNLPSAAPEPTPAPRIYWRRLFTGRAQQIDADTGKVLRLVEPGEADYPLETHFVNWS